MLKTILLYGHLRKFGREFKFDVRSPAEAIKALVAMVPGFQQHVLKNNLPGYRVYMGDEMITELTQFKLHTSAEAIRIVPVISGAGGDNNGILGIVIGVVLLVVAWYTPAPYAAFASALSNVGWAMVVGGAATMLAGSVARGGGREVAERPESNPSLAFNGVANLSGVQGAAVGLCYGKHLCGSQVVSGGLFAEQVDSATAVTRGEEAAVPIILYLDAAPPHTLDIADLTGDLLWSSPISCEREDLEFGWIELSLVENSSAIENLNQYSAVDGVYTFSNLTQALNKNYRITYSRWVE